MDLQITVAVAHAQMVQHVWTKSDVIHAHASLDILEHIVRVMYCHNMMYKLGNIKFHMPFQYCYAQELVSFAGSE